MLLFPTDVYVCKDDQEVNTIIAVPTYSTHCIRCAWIAAFHDILHEATCNVDSKALIQLEMLFTGVPLRARYQLVNRLGGKIQTATRFRCQRQRHVPVYSHTTALHRACWASKKEVVEYFKNVTLCWN